MDERDWLTQRFQEHRPRLRAVAYRMLGSTSEADDAAVVEEHPPGGPLADRPPAVGPLFGSRLRLGCWFVRWVR